jgi:hypothetical protein
MWTPSPRTAAGKSFLKERRRTGERCGVTFGLWGGVGRVSKGSGQWAGVRGQMIFCWRGWI